MKNAGKREMSYCRFLEADVYVFMHVGGFLECSACILGHEEREPFDANDTQTMIAHLKKHVESNHNVPQHVFDNLIADDEENFGGK